MSKEKSTHIRTQKIVIRKPHEAFRGAGVCTQIVRRIKNATCYLMQHHPQGKDQTLSHRDADKWLKKNNRELYTKLPPVKTQFRFSQNWNALVGDTVALEVRIVPKGNCFIIELIYDESKIVEAGRFCRLLDKSRKAGIDLGINNLIALATDQPGVRAVTNKRHRRMKDLLHRASSKVASKMALWRPKAVRSCSMSRSSTASEPGKVPLGIKTLRQAMEVGRYFFQSLATIACFRSAFQAFILGTGSKGADDLLNEFGRPTGFLRQ
jgi:hypothetical protein